MQVQLQTSLIRERGRFIVYAPALDISTSGRTLAQAKKRFAELVEIFLKKCGAMINRAVYFMTKKVSNKGHDELIAWIEMFIKRYRRALESLARK